MAATFLLSMTSCQEKDAVSLVENVSVSVGKKQVTFRGATVTVSFNAPYKWDASLVLKNGDGEWAKIKDDTIQVVRS